MSPSAPPSWNDRLRGWLSHDAHPLVQFMKYGFAGVCSAITYFGVFALLNETILPAKSGMDGGARGWNFLIDAVVAFVASNVVGFWLNVKFVFKPGRHSRSREIAMFFGLAAVAMVMGTPFGKWIVQNYPAVNEYAALAGTAVFSALVNYTGRKFIIFQK